MSELVRFSNDPAMFAKAERLFDAIAKKIRAALPAADVAHVGSTAIRGSLTKGDLDIAVRVAAADFAAAEGVLAALFARNTGSARSDEFASFLDSSADPLGVQLMAVGGKADHFLRWRDRLATDVELRRGYDELKRGFEGQSMDAYREAKARFIAERLQE